MRMKDNGSLKKAVAHVSPIALFSFPFIPEDVPVAPSLSGGNLPLEAEQADCGSRSLVLVPAMFPFDTTAQPSIAGEGHERAIAVWPNPVRDHLNIAWRGDLKRMPNRFTVHDMLGQLVASGEVEPGHGAALWRCENVVDNLYVVSMFDAEKNMIGTTTVVKQ